MPVAIDLAKLGFSKTRLHSEIINTWNLNETYLPLVEEYFLLKWETSYFFSHLNQGTLLRADNVYCVVYHGCTPKTLKNLSDTVLLSFRRCEVLGTNYVLVKPFLEN